MLPVVDCDCAYEKIVMQQMLASNKIDLRMVILRPRPRDELDGCLSPVKDFVELVNQLDNMPEYDTSNKNRDAIFDLIFLGVAINPNLAVRIDFLFPDRHGLFQFADQPFAGSERRFAMRSRD